MPDKLTPAELGTRLHQEIERLRLRCSNEQLRLYALGASLPGPDVLMIMPIPTGRITCDLKTSDGVMVIDGEVHKYDFKMIEERMAALLQIDAYNRRSIDIDLKYAVDHEPRREKARDWEQRDRKRRRR